MPPSDSTSAPLRRSGLADEVHDRIRADILSARIAPGARVSVDSLARDLGVSQTPIREALSRLEADGLVSRRPYAGYCTAPRLDRRQFEHLYEMRLVLEPAAARLAAGRITAQALVEVDRLAARMARQQQEGTHASYGRFADADARLHALVAEGTGNPLVADALARLHVPLHIFRLREHGKVTPHALREHAALIEALRRRDAAGAAAAMTDHLLASRDRLLGYLDA